MKKVHELNFGFADAENYKRRENKDLFNQVFIKNEYLEKLCDYSTSFLIGDKGTGKTAYAVYLSNNDYKGISSEIKYLRETDYQTFIALKSDNQLKLSDYAQIWKISLFLLLSNKIKNTEKSWFKFLKFKALNESIDEYYNNAFSPEILQTLNFVENSQQSAELMYEKFAKVSGGTSTSKSYTANKFQMNLMFILRKFEEAISQIRLEKDYILFIDGIDIRPSGIPYDDYLECIKGLANAIWSLNNDFFPTIKGGKGRCRIVLLVRPDIYNSLDLQNQNSKIKDNSVYLDWQTVYSNYRNSNIFKVADKLLSTQQPTPQEFGFCWNYYFSWDAKNVDNLSESNQPTSFINFLRLSYHRPRDIITLLKTLQEKTPNNDSKKVSFSQLDFDSKDFQRDYSNYLLGELKDQLMFYYKEDDYNLFLKFFEYLNGKHRFNHQEYLVAYDRTIEFIKSSDTHIPKFMNTSNDFLQFLYELNVLCFIEKTLEGGKLHIHWCFKDRNYSNISPKVKLDVEYEVFYGLRKALNLGKEFE